ncbi:SusC/RagA family TonB-linked outer membrane protein [Hymenobacter aquaticus]|nr:SusC/RagA family TonB-linked outer membrane protein [Hymenobacter aquaticus]
MPRILLVMSLLVAPCLPARAQQTDSLAGPAPDSLRAAPTGWLRLAAAGEPAPLPHFVTVQPLLSRVAGVQVTPYSGAPGAQALVRIRGAASLSGNAQPLYVVDGAPVFQNTFTPNNYSGNPTAFFRPIEASELEANPLLSIPAEDIETIEVLKGALETAQYGFQGINGVIRITTRRGRVGQTRLHYAGYGGVQQARTRYDLLDAQEYAQLGNDVDTNFGTRPRYSAAEVAAFGKGTDWQAEILRAAALHEHQVSLDGGTDKTRYYASAGYLNQQGVVRQSSLVRYNARAFVAHQFTNRFRAEAGVGLSQTQQRLPVYDLLTRTVLAPPIYPVRNPDGSYAKVIFEGNNPVQLLDEAYQRPRQNRVLGRLAGYYTLAPGLTLEVQATLERSVLHSQLFGPGISNPFFFRPGGQYVDNRATYEQWVVQPALRYRRAFADGRHTVGAALQAVRQSYEYQDENLNYLPGQEGSVGGSTSTSQVQVQSLLLTADYTFAGRYQVQGSLRRDQALFGNLDPEWLPGVQATWHAGQEAFLHGQTVVSKLDARVGWGLTSGTGHTSPGQAGGVAWYAPNYPPNTPAQQWLFRREQVRQFDAGLALGLWQDQLSVTLGAYQRRMHLEARTAQGSLAGIDGTEVLNKGLELTVAGAWQAGPVRGTTTLAAALNSNRLALPTDPAAGPVYGIYHRTEDGQPLSSFYGYDYQGLTANGLPYFRDIDNNGIITPADQVLLGSGLPRRLLSISQDLAWRRFSLLTQLDGLFGYQMLNTTLLNLDEPAGGYNSSGRVRNRWTPTNTATDVPRAGGHPILERTSPYTLQSGNHLRLSSLTLSYKVWNTDTRQISVWAGANNLFILTNYRGYDPNVSSAGASSTQAGLDAGSYPTARTILLGIKATL